MNKWEVDEHKQWSERWEVDAKKQHDVWHKPHESRTKQSDHVSQLRSRCWFYWERKTGEPGEKPSKDGRCQLQNRYMDGRQAQMLKTCFWIPNRNQTCNLLISSETKITMIYWFDWYICYLCGSHYILVIAVLLQVPTFTTAMYISIITQLKDFFVVILIINIE